MVLRGRPAFQPTTEQRKNVEVMVGLGITVRVPPGGVGAVGKWPVAATAKSQAATGYLSTAVVIVKLR
jgi:hypothetical protein